MRVLFLVLALMLTSCSSKPVEAAYVLSDGSSACAAWIEADHLVVLLLDSAVVDGYAAYAKLDKGVAIQHLIGLPAKQVMHVSQELLSSFKQLATTLAAASGGVQRDQVDAQMRLEALTKGAGYLRKTLLADTLASITGQDDPFGKLETVTQATVFDIRTSLAVSQNTDWQNLGLYLKCYVEELRRYQRKE